MTNWITRDSAASLGQKNITEKASVSPPKTKDLDMVEDNDPRVPQASCWNAKHYASIHRSTTDSVALRHEHMTATLAEIISSTI